MLGKSLYRNKCKPTICVLPGSDVEESSPREHRVVHGSVYEPTQLVYYHGVPQGEESPLLHPRAGESVHRASEHAYNGAGACTVTVGAATDMYCHAHCARHMQLCPNL